MTRRALIYSPDRKKPILWFIKKFLAGRVLFHSTCDSETGYIKSAFGSEARVVQIPIKLELPDRLDLPVQPYLLYIGRLHPKKAVENLIEAVSGSEKFRASAFTLRLAGTGEAEYVRFLEDLVRNLNMTGKIVFVGHVSGDAKQELLAAAYFSFMPSHTENFGIVVTEALAHGTPVVASATTPWAILEETKSGFWSGNSAESLAEVIDEIIEMKADEYSQMRANSVETAQLFDIRQHGKDWTETYETLLAGRRDF